jgi:hypothetical protein
VRQLHFGELIRQIQINPRERVEPPAIDAVDGWVMNSLGEIEYLQAVKRLMISAEEHQVVD